jgi:oligopeptide/dipeptide ABC transporter ATP-binding protein
MPENLLEVKNLKSYFYTDEGIIKAVDDISFNVKRGETLGVVGESGCGKSVTSLSIMRLLPNPKGRIEGGSIKYTSETEEIDITKLNPHGSKIRSLRGNEMAMIFQEPMTSLNPLYTVGSQIMEAINLHQNIDKNSARKKAIEILDKVGISAPDKRVDDYPHQLSGGMRQRVMIAMALSCDPSFLIADEPTTALDVTIEAQILNLMDELQDEFNMSIMIITHDLGVIGEMADRVIVMYTGKVVERANTDDIFYNPKHPYTKGLLKSIPKIGNKARLSPIKGSVPNLLRLPDGCYFEPRCEYAKEICSKKEPPMFKISEEQAVKCWLYDDKEEV